VKVYMVMTAKLQSSPKMQPTIKKSAENSVYLSYNARGKILI